MDKNRRPRVKSKAQHISGKLDKSAEKRGGGRAKGKEFSRPEKSHFSSREAEQPDEQEGKRRILDLFIRNGVPLPEQTETRERMIEQIWKLHLFLQSHNDDRDLSRLVHFDEMAIKHYLDCALVLKYTDLPSPVIDIGTGAGFPGLVLKILSPETEIILGETRKKRVEYLDAAITHLGLQGISTYGHRVGPSFPIPVNGVITRALEVTLDTLNRASNFLPRGGKVILMKGPGVRQEEGYPSKARGEGGDFVEKKFVEFSLDNTRHRRTIVVFERVRESIDKVEQYLKRNYIIMGGSDKTQDGHTGKGWKVNTIVSPANPFFRMLSKLEDARQIKKEGKYLFYGIKGVEELLQKDNLSIESVIVSPSHLERYQTIFRKGERITVLEERLFREIDRMGTNSPVLLLSYNDESDLPAWDGRLSDQGVDLFLPFQDPGNVGTVIRTAHAFGINRVILLKEAALPYQPRAQRAAGSALLQIPLLQGPSLRELCEEDRFLGVRERLYLLEKSGTPISTGYPISEKIENGIGVIAGLEGQGFSGVTDTSGFQKISIPIIDESESLNGAVAVGIVLFSLKNRPV